MLDRARRSRTPNRLLSLLSRDDFGLLEPHLEPVDLPVRKQLEACNRRIGHVYFIESGFASIVADGLNRPSIEVGIIGREGMTGLAIVMGTDRSPHETFIQVAGGGLRIATANLRQGMEQSATLRRCFLRYGHSFMIQTAQTALSNGRSNIEQRLARWLLMAHDRIGEEALPLTHEFLAMMLGVRRAGVSVALRLLEREGLIAAERGVIMVLDRKGLEGSSNRAYGAPEAELQRLFR
jgi:CRP-like cAMP-binding protein